MATIRFSLNPQDNDHQVVQAAGLAVVTKSIEITVDFDGMAVFTPNMSQTQRNMQVAIALRNFAAYLETTGKFSTAG